jgi:hypothetical protein
MSLGRAWRRHLLGASSAALIVPSATAAALAVLALGGGFGSIGLLGQLFAGPSLPGVVLGSSGGGYAGSRGVATASLPVVPALAPRRVVVRHVRAGRPVLTANRGTGAGGGAGTAGGAIGGSGGAGVRPVTEGAGGSSGGGSSGSGPGSSGSGSGSGSSGSGSGSFGSGSGSGSPSPQPSPPPPQPSPVDTAVKVVTSVTQQLPAPVGPVVGQTVQAAGGAVDNLLPQIGQP